MISHTTEKEKSSGKSKKKKKKGPLSALKPKCPSFQVPRPRKWGMGNGEWGIGNRE
jgi:hypothetical protein